MATRDPCSTIRELDECEEHCWICLGGPKLDEPLVLPCSCPRKVHKKCMALWQLHSAGKQEEKTCRFCNKLLPDWKPQLTPANLKPAVPVVSVHYNGTCYRIRVRPGPEGFAQFQKQLQRITGMPMLEAMQITFQCKAPESAQELSFKGISAFDAAIHCAAISAAERLAVSGKTSSASQQQQNQAAGPFTRSGGVFGGFSGFTSALSSGTPASSTSYSTASHNTTSHRTASHDGPEPPLPMSQHTAVASTQLSSPFQASVYSDPGGPARGARASHEVTSLQHLAVLDTSLGRHSVHMHEHAVVDGNATVRFSGKAKVKLARLREFFMKIWV